MSSWSILCTLYTCFCVFHFSIMLISPLSLISFCCMNYCLVFVFSLFACRFLYGFLRTSVNNNNAYIMRLMFFFSQRSNLLHDKEMQKHNICNVIYFFTFAKNYGKTIVRIDSIQRRDSIPESSLCEQYIREFQLEDCFSTILNRR